MVILWYRRDTPHARLLLEAQLLSLPLTSILPFLQNALRVRRGLVGEGGYLHGGEATLVEARVADRGTDGRG